MSKKYNKMELWQLELELKVNEKFERYERCAEIRDLINLIKYGEENVHKKRGNRASERV